MMMMNLDQSIEQIIKIHDELVRKHNLMRDERNNAVDHALNLTRERDEVARERDDLKDQNATQWKALEEYRTKLYEAEKLAEERLASIKQLQTRLKTKKAFNFAAKYSASPDWVDAAAMAFSVPKNNFQFFGKPFRLRRDWFTPQHPKNPNMTAGAPCDQPTWNLLTPEAAEPVRSRRFTPITRTVHEWNLAAQNLKCNMPERHGFRWTRSEEEKLVADYRAQKPLDHFARMHKRHPDAIARRIAKLVNFAGMAARRKWELEDNYTARLVRMYFPASYSQFTSVLRKPGFEPRYTTYTG